MSRSFRERLSLGGTWRNSPRDRAFARTLPPTRSSIHGPYFPPTLLQRVVRAITRRR